MAAINTNNEVMMAVKRRVKRFIGTKMKCRYKNQKEDEAVIMNLAGAETCRGDW
jgi:hypothetical protein